MSKEISIPGLGFDPRSIGPFELARLKYRQFKAWVSDPIVASALLGAFVVLVLGAWYLEVPVPSIPAIAWVLLLVSILGSGTFWLFASRLTEALHTPETELLVAVDAEDGNQQLMTVAPDRFEEMRVVNENGVERGTDYLHTIYVNGVKGYEIDSYDAERNVAVASWQAGATNRQMRAHRTKVDEVKTDLEEQTDLVFEVMINNTSMVREHAAEVSNDLIQVAEGIETPGDHESLSKRLRESMDELDVEEDLVSTETSEELAEDPDGDDVDDDSDDDSGSTVSIEVTDS